MAQFLCCLTICFFGSPESRILFACSLDGTLVAYRARKEFELAQVLKVSDPLHCMAWDATKQRILCGSRGKLYVFSHEWDKLASHEPFMSKKDCVLQYHTDVITALVSVDARVFSAGYKRSPFMNSTIV